MKSFRNVILNVAQRSEESLTHVRPHIRVRSFVPTGASGLRMTDIVTDIIRHVCAYTHCPKRTAASIVFIGDAKMRKLNRQYRGQDKTTNVLAFPVTPHPPLSPRERETAGRVRGDLGDIFICLPEAKREAKQYGWTLDHEIARLALHGFLHLLGYDHVRDNEAKVMEKMERKILNAVAV